MKKLLLAAAVSALATGAAFADDLRMGHKRMGQHHPEPRVR